MLSQIHVFISVTIPF